VFETPAPSRRQYKSSTGRRCHGQPYLALGVLVMPASRHRAQSRGAGAGPKDPEKMDAEERRRLGIVRLPTSLAQSLAAFEADATIKSWFPRASRSLSALQAWEIATLGALEPAEQMRPVQRGVLKRATTGIRGDAESGTRSFSTSSSAWSMICSPSSASRP